MPYTPAPVSGPNLTPLVIEENFRRLVDRLGGAGYFNSGIPYSTAQGTLELSLLDRVDITLDTLTEPYSLISANYVIKCVGGLQDTLLWVPPGGLLISARAYPFTAPFATVKIGTTLGGQEVAASQVVANAPLTLTSNPYALPASGSIYVNDALFENGLNVTLTLTIKVPVVS